MISVAWNSNFAATSDAPDPHLQQIMQAFESLPRHIARKHLQAAMRRILRAGVPVLRRNTPPLGTRRGRRGKGERPKSTGDLRRSATTKVGQSGRGGGSGSVVWAVLGYRAGFESRKAIWHQFGTRTGLRARQMIEKTLAEFGPVSSQQLAQAMAAALPKAIAEVSGGMNPGRE